MQLRRVVTCFLRRADGRLLLGRRSQGVSTYPGHWAAISGSVEQAGPREQAYREIAEETGLAPDAVAPLAEGRPVRFPAWDLGVRWVVHPFLFRCDEPDRVRRDWEHVEFEWVAPERIAELQTVPKLADAYRSAAEADSGPDWRDAFERVRRDREHGAAELGLWTLEALRDAARSAPGAPDDIMGAMRAACREAADLRPSMAAVLSAALEAFGACRKRLAGQGGSTEALEADLIHLIHRREEAPLRAAGAAAELIPPGSHVVTLSYSSTVLCALNDAASRIARLTVAESRPACEGRRTAELAASFGIPTELVTDAVAASRAHEADFFLFGADSIADDGSVVNKAGTLALCCAAAPGGALALCAATEDKVLPAGREPRIEEMSPDELGDEIPGVQRRNPCFERVPADLVGRIVTGPSPLTRERLTALSKRLRELFDALEVRA